MSTPYFNKGDRRIIIILSTIAVTVFAAIVLFGLDKRGKEQRNDTEQQNTAQAPVKERQHNTDGIDTPLKENDEAAEGLQPFDPNTVDSITLIHNGLRPYQAHALLRYRQAGAVFRKPLDIARLNCLEDEDIDRLLPLIRISKQYSERRTKYPIGASYEAPNSQYATSHSASGHQVSPRGDVEGAGKDPRPSKFTTLTPVDINTADTTLLKRIPGIGSYTASKIVKMRTQLGGYHSAQQLLTLTNLSADLLEWFVINPTNLRQINLNTSTFNQLRQHPHIGYDHARDLTRYIRLYGKIKDERQLRSTNIFSDDELQLLLPYVEY